MSLSAVRDVVGTPRERILNMSSSLRGCQAFGEKRKEGGKKQSVMILTGSKSETFFLMRQRAVKKLVN